ncbi:3-hydroxyacyl-CoA dehydrogenase/enoyl-CoA hydratase family protein [Acidilobus sp.]|jgi:enoyl-CoA hydratase/3-hydroxyacyl-CoA dehydrogenase|uniref:3-hydroxyacyl-CoA dehydrogenase/enoyl-CoA hydratase family protein n=1 Tax=Acidilobus sp. TaxID=1872109 RepID=UPI003CFD8A6B
MVSANDVKQVLVVGAGTMGHGIAEVFAIAGYNVFLADVNRQILDSAMDKIRWSLSKLAEKGQLKESVDSVMSRITAVISVNPDGSFSNDLAAAASQADMMIEAITEKLDAKQALFRFVDQHRKGKIIMATNTSSLPITEIASVTSSPELVVGMHFFNPPPLMPLIEVIKGERTSDDVVQSVVDLAKRIGKQPVVVNKDVPGFIVNRILARFLNTACWLVAKGRASVLEVDSTVRFSLGFPMGAFELADYSGIDVFYLIAVAMTQRGFRQTPCPLFEQMYKANTLGMKTGKGFYEYPKPGAYVRPQIPKDLAGKVDPVTLIAGAVNEAAWLLENGIATKEDIDKAVKLGLGWPKGVFELADQYGIDSIVATLSQLKQDIGPEYSPEPLLTQMVSQGTLGVKTGKGFYEYGHYEEVAKSTLIVRYEKPIAWIILNRPNKLNAINVDMINELSQTLDEIEQNPDVRVIILTGSGKAFSAGADITGFAGITPIQAAIFSRKFQELTLKMEYYTKPIIVAINGYALGGGLEIAMSGDIRIAAETAMLGQPEINLGFIPGAGGTQRLPRLIGRSSAKLLIFTGDMVSAKDAKELGLVDYVVPPERLEQEARSLALKLAEKPPLALLAAKLAVEMGLESNIWAGLALESQLFGLLFSTKDVVEGVSAFLEKRKPSFKGE